MKKHIVISTLSAFLLSASPAFGEVISYVDTSLKDSQKYFLCVGGKPFYMTNVQVRLDLLRYAEGWNAKAMEALMAQVAADGFNTVSIPIHWYEVERDKDRFDWKILDEYLSLANKYGLKMELLWFGANSGGHVQWLGRGNTEGNHLRTPDYVLYSPAPGSKDTSSEFTIIREMSDYSLDMKDTRLRDREKYVLAKVIEHISRWDKSHARKHPVIGVQINNEAIGQKGLFSNSDVVSYLNHVAGAVKESDYEVWTRVNCVFWNIYARIHENERLRQNGGTNLDIIGLDTYRHHFPSDASFIASMRDNIPYVGKNMRMIMETNSGVPYAAQMHLSALSGNNAFNYYSVEALYGRDNDTVKELVGHIGDIRLNNKILTSDMTDLATKSHGYGLFVHNAEGVNSAQSVSNHGIAFDPAYPTSQGISIRRSGTEYVLMSSKGGRFTLPDTLNATDASEGYFDSDDKWTTTGPIQLDSSTRQFDSPVSNQTSIYVNPGMTVLVNCLTDSAAREPYATYQAEDACFGGGVTAASDTEGIGFAGNGYAKFPPSEGAYLVWENIPGAEGGESTLRIRYSNGSGRQVRYQLSVNGRMSHVFLDDTGGWDRYATLDVAVNLNPGNENRIQLESTGNYKRNNRVVYPLPSGFVDEINLTR